MLGQSPISILGEQITTLLRCLPAIRDGNDDAIHDARVLTRRIRELLRVARTGLDEGEASAIADMIRHAGRALGEVRDPDVSLELINELETRFPAAAAMTHPLRGAAAMERRTARRRLVKTLETLDLATLPLRVARAHRRGRFSLRRDRSGWRDSLRQHVASRAADVREAMHHATGVYFPNRSHAVRVAIKKLRYAVELADATGVWHAPRALRRLSKAQEALGRAHDRQVLIDRLQDAASRNPDTAQATLDVAVPFLEADLAAVHEKYLAMRPEIARICDAGEGLARPRRARPALIAAGVAIPSLFLVSRAAARPRHDDAEAVRVTVRVS